MGEKVRDSSLALRMTREAKDEKMGEGWHDERGMRRLAKDDKRRLSGDEELLIRYIDRLDTLRETKK